MFLGSHRCAGMDSRPFVPFRPVNASDKAGPIHQAAIRAALANCCANRSNSSEKIKLNSALGVDLGRHFLLAGLALCCVPCGVVGITGLAADRRTTMDPWMCASLILAAGALGGVVNALITDNGFVLPTVHRGIWCPGFVGTSWWVPSRRSPRGHSMGPGLEWNLRSPPARPKRITNEVTRSY